MKVLLIIPARYGSTRFEGKPLALLAGVPIIERVYRRAQEVRSDDGSPCQIVVATDDDRIAAVVEGFGGNVVITSTEHRSGTDRCREAYDKWGVDVDVVINIQGDEPFIKAAEIETLIDCMSGADRDIATLAAPFDRGCSIEQIENPNTVKVVIGSAGQALYFSRSVVPYLRGVDRAKWSDEHTFYRHIGVYAFRPDVLRAVSGMEPSPLEIAESLEQLRWAEAGYKIAVGLTDSVGGGIDTPEDLQRAEELINNMRV